MEAVDAPVAPPSVLPRILLAAALVAGFLLRARVALTDDGISWPDEIYQSLEPAHRLVFGYGLVAWEYSQGARTWALPGFVALVMELSRALHLPEPRGYLLLVRFAFCGLGTATAYAVHRLARALGAAELPSALGAASFALCAPFLYFGPRALSETASALPVALGFALLLPKDATARQRAPGVALLGLSVILRLHNAVFCAGLLAVLLVQRDWPRLRQAALVLGACALLFGALDWLTWGAPFHSALVYLRFTLVEGKSNLWGTSDATFYLRVLLHGMPVPTVLLAGLALLSALRAPALLAISLLFVLLHVATPHKELRFLLPVLPLLCALAAVGLGEFLSAESLRLRIAGGLTATLLAIAISTSAVRLRALTFADVGEYEGVRDGVSAFDDWGDANRLLEKAGKLPDLCGLKVEAVHLAWTGGYSFFHRRAPLYHARGPARGSGLFNYVIAWRGAPGQLIASDRNVELRKIAGSCRPDPSYSWALP